MASTCPWMVVELAVSKLQNYIGGELLDPLGGAFLESINPATGQVLAQVPDSCTRDIDRAVEAAKQAAKPWRDLGIQRRAVILNKMADLLDAHLDKLVEAEINDNGMTRGFASSVEVPRGAANFRSFAQAALDFCEPQAFKAAHAQGYIRHEPVGAVGPISPWNLPMLEMGGKNPSLVFADADFDAAVECIKKAAFANQGQICFCGSRIYVEKSIYEKFRVALVESTKSIKIGDPLSPEAQHGATVSKAHMTKVLSCIEVAKSEGGKVLCGGQRQHLTGRCAESFFVEPTLLEGLNNSTRTNQKEIFGPVATLTPFDTEEEAISLANDSCYGLAASVWTEDLDKATRVADALETGMPCINCWNLRVLKTPFGGYKNSGNGHREGVPDAMELFTEKKAVTMPNRKDS